MGEMEEEAHVFDRKSGWEGHGDNRRGGNHGNDALELHFGGDWRC